MTHSLWHQPRTKFASGAAVAASALFLVACTDTPQKLSDVEMSISQELVAQGAAELSTGAPVSLRGGLRGSVLQAVQANDAYRAAQAIETEALANISAVVSGRRPQLGLTANAGSLRENDAAGDVTTGVAGGLNISQLVFDGGENTASVNRATAQALAARAEREARGNALALDAARAWIDVWQFDERLGKLRSRTAEMDTVIEQIERMASNGMIDRAALDSARRQVVDISLEEARLDASLKDAQVRFARFFNVPGARVGRPDEVVSLGQATAQAGQWQESPILQRTAAEVFVARNAVAIAQSAFQPRARLEAGIRSPMDADEPTNTSVGLSLTYTIGDGGRRQAALQSAEARLAATEAQLVDERRSLEAELNTALSRLASIQSSMPLLDENIRLTASEAQAARSQIVTGQSNLRRLIEAEIDNYRARDAQIAMQAEKMVLQLTIAARTGALGRVIGLDLPDAEQ
jgi:outer membrane protein TolC